MRARPAVLPPPLLLLTVLHRPSCHLLCCHPPARAPPQWDPKSDSYLLIGNKSGAMCLYDVEARQPVWTFERISGGLQALTLLCRAPC